MTQRPGKIEQIIPVELDRTRDRSSSAFLHLRGEIPETLHFAGQPLAGNKGQPGGTRSGGSWTRRNASLLSLSKALEPVRKPDRGQRTHKSRWTKPGVRLSSGLFDHPMPHRRKLPPEDDLDESGPRLRAVNPPLTPDEPTDLELMQGIQREDPDALSKLYDRYNGVIKALTLRVVHNETEADDLLQEIFMELWNQAKNFSAQKGKPLGWMVTLARRRAIDGLRKKQAYLRAGERLQHETEQQPDAWVHNGTEEQINSSDTRTLIRQVIASLPPAQQEAIDFAFFLGMSQREIAAKTNTPLGTVKTRLELGLKKIYDGLKNLRDEL